MAPDPNGDRLLDRPRAHSYIGQIVEPSLECDAILRPKGSHYLYLFCVPCPTMIIGNPKSLILELLVSNAADEAKSASREQVQFRRLFGQ
jgi:hypothetical protein